MDPRSYARETRPTVRYDSRTHHERIFELLHAQFCLACVRLCLRCRTPGDQGIILHGLQLYDRLIRPPGRPE
eukprot:147910-Prymnesium_polylepis.1